jgi:ribose-phosphate pyrophosphokinase
MDDPKQSDELMIFAGSGSKALTARICRFLGTPVRRSQAHVFSDGNTFVRVLENVRGRDVFLVQSTVHRTNDNFMELLFWIDAFKRASASSVTAVIPYFSYGKGDKKDEPRVSIRARVCADAIEAAGADRVVTMDLHAPQIQGFFRIPVDNLYGHPTLCDRIRELASENFVIVAPDTGFADEARRYADYLDCPVAIGDKQRTQYDEKAEVLDIIGDVAGKTAVVVDDFVLSAGTLVDVARKLREKGAERLVAAATHGVFSAGSIERIDASPIERLLITDTVENQPVQFSEKIEVVSAAPCLGEAIKRIHNRESISAMFP